MNIVTRNPKFFWALIAFMVLGSLWEMYPLTNQSLIQEFKNKADQRRPERGPSIKSSARRRNCKRPIRTRRASSPICCTAIGTNDIQQYFPYNNVRGQENPTYTLLNILQRKAAGKIHLGLDLQGGTEFRVSLDTNHVSATDTNHAAVNASDERKRLVSQAIDDSAQPGGFHGRGRAAHHSGGREFHSHPVAGPFPGGAGRSQDENPKGGLSGVPRGSSAEPGDFIATDSVNSDVDTRF